MEVTAPVLGDGGPQGVDNPAEKFHVKLHRDGDGTWQCVSVDNR